MFSRRASIFAIVLCDLAMMCLAIGVNLMPVFLTQISSEMGGLNKEQLGRIGAVTFAGIVAGIVVAGPLADRWGGRKFAIAGNVLVSLGLAILRFSPGYQTILLGCAVMGIGAGVLDMILSPVVSALQPHRRTVAMNLLHSFYCIGAVATILAGSLALRHGIGWRVLSLMLLPMPLLVAIGFAVTPLPPLVQDGQDRTPLSRLLRHPFMLVAMIAIFLGGATELGMAYWLPAYAEKSLGYSKWTAGLAFVGFSLAMAIGRLGILVLPRSVGPIRLMLFCCAGSVILFLLASFAPRHDIALASCVLAGLAGSCLWPSTLAVAADRFPHGGASMFALLSALGNIGGIFMPWGVGVIADHSALNFGLAVAALCPLLLMICLIWMGLHARRFRADT